MKEIEKEVVRYIGGVLSNQGWKLRAAIARQSKEFYGYYLKPPPPHFEQFWFGVLDYPKVSAKGIFVAVNPVNMQTGMKLLDEGFKSFSLWGTRDWWFIKRLTSETTIKRLQKTPPEQWSDILEVILANTYPFSV